LKYAEVIGDPIAHSKSPAIHRFWFEALGLQADYRVAHVRSGELAAYLRARRADPDWVGCNVTMPHKQAVVAHLDRLDLEAELLQAVNTVVRAADGSLTGFNTDVDGVAEPLRRHRIGDYPNHVATYVQIIGAGGAARAALRGCVLAGLADFDFFNRTVAHAIEIARWVDLGPHHAHGLEAIWPIRNPDDGPEDQRYSHVVINATSMGMLGQDAVPIDLSRYYPDTIVFDMVYAPPRTPLLQQARAMGMRTIDGLEMLVGQAARAFELFFGVVAPRERDTELRARLAGR
jgi:shikimate dehydrogenase